MICHSSSLGRSVMSNTIVCSSPRGVLVQMYHSSLIPPQGWTSGLFPILTITSNTSGPILRNRRTDQVALLLFLNCSLFGPSQTLMTGHKLKFYFQLKKPTNHLLKINPLSYWRIESFIKVGGPNSACDENHGSCHRGFHSQSGPTRGYLMRVFRTLNRSFLGCK